MPKPVKKKVTTKTHFVTSDQIGEWVRLFRAEWSVRRIAEKFGVHTNTVWYHLKKLDISRREVKAAGQKQLKKALSI